MSEPLTKTSYVDKNLIDENGRMEMPSLVNHAQNLNSYDWLQWFEDRLHGRDQLLPLDPRQDDEPEFLFIELIPMLGIARGTAEKGLQITLNRAISAPWHDKPLAGLFFMVESLRVTLCVSTLLRYLEAPFSNNKPRSLKQEPYSRAISALAALQSKQPERRIVDIEYWKKWTGQNQVDFLSPAIRGLIHTMPQIASPLLKSFNWKNWENSELAEALLDDLELFFLSTRPSEAAIFWLDSVALHQPEFRDAMFSILPDIGNIDAWTKQSFAVIRRTTTYMYEHRRA